MKKQLVRVVLAGALLVLFAVAGMFFTLCKTKLSEQKSPGIVWNGQLWEKWSLSSISPTSDNGTICAGKIYLLQKPADDGQSFPNIMVDFCGLVIKTDGHAKVQWYKIFGDGKNPVFLVGAVETVDGGCIVAGQSKVNTDGKTGFDFSKGKETAKLWKLDGKGNTLWEKDYGTSLHQRFNSLIRTSDNNYVAAGVATHEGSSGDVRVMKFDIDGKVIWDKTLGGKKADWAFAVIQTSDGGYAVTGYSESMGKQMNSYVAKLTPAGELEWEKTYPGRGVSDTFSICQASDGGYAVTGWTEQEKKMDFFVFKTDKTGNLEWEKFFEGGELAGGASILPVEGGYLVAGRKNGAWLAKIASSGNLLWEKTVMENSYADIKGKQIPGSKNFLFAGSTGGKFGAGVIMEVDPNGKTIWQVSPRLILDN